jgi:hypothetical protein
MMVTLSPPYCCVQEDAPSVVSIIQEMHRQRDGIGMSKNFCLGIHWSGTHYHDIPCDTVTHKHVIFPLPNRTAPQQLKTLCIQEADSSTVL